MDRHGLDTTVPLIGWRNVKEQYFSEAREAPRKVITVVFRIIIRRSLQLGVHTWVK